MPDKVDVKKQYKQIYAPKREPHLVEVPTLRYMMIDGEGAPDGEAFQEAIGALYGAAYATKFRFKADGQADFVVPPLEALWWADDPSAFADQRRAEWRWTLMLAQPGHVADEDLARTARDLDGQGKSSAALRSMRSAELAEGRAVQCLYIGPYDAMAATIAQLYAFAEANGLELAGKHHDVYLSDPRRTQPGKLKSILRRPVR